MRVPLRNSRSRCAMWLIPKLEWAARMSASARSLTGSTL